jgi:hypothetical protein
MHVNIIKRAYLLNFVVRSSTYYCTLHKYKNLFQRNSKRLDSIARKSGAIASLRVLQFVHQAFVSETYYSRSCDYASQLRHKGMYAILILAY